VDRQTRQDVTDTRRLVRSGALVPHRNASASVRLYGEQGPPVVARQRHPQSRAATSLPPAPRGRNQSAPPGPRMHPTAIREHRSRAPGTQTDARSSRPTPGRPRKMWHPPLDCGAPRSSLVRNMRIARPRSESRDARLLFLRPSRPLWPAPPIGIPKDSAPRGGTHSTRKHISSSSPPTHNLSTNCAISSAFMSIRQPMRSSSRSMRRAKSRRSTRTQPGLPMKKGPRRDHDP